MGFDSMEICGCPMGRSAPFLLQDHPNETTENVCIEIRDTVSALPPNLVSVGDGAVSSPLHVPEGNAVLRRRGGSVPPVLVPGGAVPLCLSVLLIQWERCAVATVTLLTSIVFTSGISEKEGSADVFILVGKR